MGPLISIPLIPFAINGCGVLVIVVIYEMLVHGDRFFKGMDNFEGFDEERKKEAH